MKSIPLIDEKTARRNLYAYCKRAKPEHWQAGATWYKDANRFCTLLSKASGQTTEAIAGTVAALSPQCSWKENLRATLALVKTGDTGDSLTLPVNRDKAKRILAGETPLTVLGGCKVRAFYDNILNPASSESTTIDTHAARVLFRKHDLTPKELSWIFRPNGNKVAQNVYKAVAKHLGLRVCELQATLWLVVKEELSGKPVIEEGGLYIK